MPAATKAQASQAKGRWARDAWNAIPPIKTAAARAAGRRGSAADQLCDKGRLGSIAVGSDSIVQRRKFSANYGRFCMDAHLKQTKLPPRNSTNKTKQRRCELDPAGSEFDLLS